MAVIHVTSVKELSPIVRDIITYLETRKSLDHSQKLAVISAVMVTYLKTLKRHDRVIAYAHIFAEVGERMTDDRMYSGMDLIR